MASVIARWWPRPAPGATAAPSNSPLRCRVPIGLGCMRLSTEPTRTNGLAVLVAALDAGVDLLDTADAYALDDADRGHNERLIAAAIAGRAVTVVTKGGLTR